MGLILAAGLVLAAGLPCEKRSSDLSAPPASPLVKLGRPALAGLPSCGEGEIPVHASPPFIRTIGADGGTPCCVLLHRALKLVFGLSLPIRMGIVQRQGG